MRRPRRPVPGLAAFLVGERSESHITRRRQAVGDTVSAVPSVLTGWAAWAQAQNPTLANAARRADAAIQAFNGSRPDPAVVTHPVPYPGENVVSYATRNGEVDRWVGKVGEAFFAIATKDIPPAAVQYESSAYSNKRISGAVRRMASGLAPHVEKGDGRTSRPITGTWARTTP
jgi:hypothetical protein